MFIYFLLSIVYIFVGVVAGRVVHALVASFDNSPASLFVGMFWPIGIPILISVYLSKRPANWIVSKLQ